MFKRARWMIMGYSLGATTSYLAARRLRRAALKYTPNEVANRVGATVGGTARQLQHAVAEGRGTMRDREAQLRSAHSIDRGARHRLRTK
jgi:dienelactone hydrolase